MPEELRPFRPVPIRVINAVSVAMHGVFGVDLIPLDAEQLVAEACDRFDGAEGAEGAEGAKGAKRCDFGEGAEEWGDFRTGLDVFVAALKEEAGLTLIGRVVATHRIAMLLDQRLQLVAYWRDARSTDMDTDTNSNTPVALVGGDVDSPVFVVGLPRTGTSFLHTLLSQDVDNFRAPLNWMVVDPVRSHSMVVIVDTCSSRPGA